MGLLPPLSKRLQQLHLLLLIVLLLIQDRLLGEDGEPRKVQEEEDPDSMGLVLEWVYGTIVSTAEKARESAKRSLGTVKLLWVLPHD